MQVLRVAQKVYPDVTGGGPYHVHALSRDQAEMGHDVTVMTVGDGPRLEERDGYTVVRFRSWGSILGNDIAPGVGRHLLGTDGFDVVHAHSHLYASTNLAALARRVGGPPLAITNHGLYSQTAPEWVFDVYLRTAGRWTLDSADVVFCYTPQDRDRLRRLGVETAVEVVPNGVDTERFRPVGPTEADRTGDGPVVLFVGRLVEGKRPLDVVEAFLAVKEAFPEASLRVCGDGPLMAAIAERARRSGVADAVHLLGHVAYDEMPAVYRAADVLVLPSRAEGFPRTMLEAMACDVPVVVSDLEQIRDAVAGGGETVPVGDVAAISDAIVEVLRSPGDYDPRGCVADSYDWTETVRRTNAALESLTDGPVGD